MVVYMGKVTLTIYITKIYLNILFCNFNGKTLCINMFDIKKIMNK